MPPGVTDNNYIMFSTMAPSPIWTPPSRASSRRFEARVGREHHRRHQWRPRRDALRPRPATSTTTACMSRRWSCHHPAPRQGAGRRAPGATTSKGPGAYALPIGRRRAPGVELRRSIAFMPMVPARWPRTRANSTSPAHVMRTAGAHSNWKLIVALGARLPLRRRSSQANLFEDPEESANLAESHRGCRRPDPAHE